MAKMLKTSKEEITLAMESYNPVESIHSSAYNKDGDEICILDRLSTNIDEETQIVNKISIKQLIISIYLYLFLFHITWNGHLMP